MKLCYIPLKIFLFDVMAIAQFVFNLAGDIYGEDNVWYNEVWHIRNTVSCTEFRENIWAMEGRILVGHIYLANGSYLYFQSFAMWLYYSSLYLNLHHS